MITIRARSKRGDHSLNTTDRASNPTFLVHNLLDLPAGPSVPLSTCNESTKYNIVYSVRTPAPEATRILEPTLIRFSACT